MKLFLKSFAAASGTFSGLYISYIVLEVGVREIAVRLDKAIDKQ